ncbi:MAG: hypothetical protein SFV32_13265 [Opitutaceae bacterium]|nr:hypothetical protein [Opitutaceae bacterium]
MLKQASSSTRGVKHRGSQRQAVLEGARQSGRIDDVVRPLTFGPGSFAASTPLRVYVSLYP